MRFFLTLTICIISLNLGAQKGDIKLLMRNSDYQGAILLIDTKLRDNSLLKEEIRTLYIQRVNCLKKMYHYEEAVRSLHQYNTLYSNIADGLDFEMYSELAECYSLNGDLEDALACYALLSAANQSNSYFTIQKSYLLYRMEDYKSSIAEAKSLISNNGSSLPLLSLVGNSYNVMGMRDSALVYYDKCLEISPFNENIINNKSAILLAEKRYDEVIGLVEKYLLEVPDNIVINKIYGVTLYLKKNYVKSSNIFNKLISLGYESYDVYYYLGMNYFLLEKKYEADTVFKKAYQIDSSKVDLVYYYAASKGWKQYKFDESKRLYDKAIKMLAQDSVMLHKVYVGYALGYYNTMQYEKAIDSYKNSLTFNPSYHSALVSIGYCYELMKNYKEALHYYKLFLSKKLSDSDKKSTEARIERVKGELFWEQ